MRSGNLKQCARTSNIIRTTTTWILLTIASGSLPAESPKWRFWNRADGLPEPFTSSISPDAKGNIWIKHGDVPSMTVFDGYSVRTVPDPRAWRTSASWAGSPSGMVYFKDGKWIPLPSRADLQDLIGVVSLNDDRALAL